MNADQVADELERFVERMVVKITLDAHANLVEATPVDVGWAQANWVPELGLPNPPSAPSPGTSAAAAARKGAQQAAVAAIVAGYSFPEKVTIYNNVPYIGRLNDGWSQQAPKGFVQRAINKALTTDLGGLAA